MTVASAILAQYGPKLKTALPGPEARRIVEADDRLISPSYTRSYPLVAKRGSEASSARPMASKIACVQWSAVAATAT